MDSISLKKHKISLEDYPIKQDLENRLLMAQFTPHDIVVLEEILYSSLRLPIQKLEKSTALGEGALLPILMKLSRTGLFAFEEDTLVVDKDLRKYFEGQIVRFDPAFRPGMEFIQSLLKKVPIHVLPVWYSLPRLSNHIFESIIEKHLLTPHIFQRYLADLQFVDPLLSSIIKEVYASPDLKVYGKDLIEKYHLTRPQFEELILQLEFYLVCFLSYERQGEEYKEIVTPFHEWCDYVSFLKATQTHSVPTQAIIEKKRPFEFSYVEDLSKVLAQAQKQPLIVSEEKGKKVLPSDTQKLLLSLLCTGSIDADYLSGLVQKLCQLKLATLAGGRLSASENAPEFLELSQANQALFLYRHPLNRQVSPSLPLSISTDRNLREAEKSILRVLTTGWVYFDEFIKGVVASLNETTAVTLKKQGKTWKYQLPSYSDEELAFIKAVVLEWLFEIGITSVGKVNGRDCFCVTAFGQSLFGQ